VSEQARYGWDGAAPDGNGFGTCGSGPAARADSEAWLRAHPAGQVRLGLARFGMRTGDLVPVWYLARVADRARLDGQQILWDSTQPMPGGPC
jgi:hypothetical protein